MLEPTSPCVFEIAFVSPPRLRDIVRASPVLPLPPVPIRAAPMPPPPPPSPDPAAILRAEKQAIEQTLTHLRQAAEQLRTSYDTMTAEMRQAAVELAVAVAGRAVFDKLQAGDFPIEEMVRQAVARLPAAPAVTVYLHPEDLALLRRRIRVEGGGWRVEGEELSVPSTLHPPPSTRIRADPSLSRGGCRAEAEEIHVLTDLATQLAELRQHLLWSASHAQSGSGPSAS